MLLRTGQVRTGQIRRTQVVTGKVKLGQEIIIIMSGLVKFNQFGTR